MAEAAAGKFTMWEVKGCFRCCHARVFLNRLIDLTQRPFDFLHYLIVAAVEPQQLLKKRRRKKRKRKQPQQVAVVSSVMTTVVIIKQKPQGSCQKKLQKLNPTIIQIKSFIQYTKFPTNLVFQIFAIDTLCTNSVGHEKL